MTRDLRSLPKAHLHVHLEGAMRPATLAELAARSGAPAPETAREEFTDFTQFLALYGAAADAITTEADLRRLVREVVQDAAADGAVWVEPHCNPFRHTARLGTPAHVVDVLLDEGAAAAAATGVGFGLVVAVDRTAPREQALAAAAVAADRAGSGVVALGLASDEVAGPPELFADAFALAREAGLLSVPHAGELVGPASVRGALDALHADRLAHGLRVVEDDALLARVVAQGTALDVCPSSNVALSVVPSLAEHPLPQLLAAGARCSLNADDPLLFGPSLLAEYEIARSVLGLDDAALAGCARTSLEASGAPPALVAAGCRAIDDWLSPDPARTAGTGPQPSARAGAGGPPTPPSVRG